MATEPTVTKVRGRTLKRLRRYEKKRKLTASISNRIEEGLDAMEKLEKGGEA